MPTKTTPATPWHDLEQQAYHAYREWPIWLVLRECELHERGAAGRADQRSPGAAPTAEKPERQTTVPGGKTE